MDTKLIFVISQPRAGSTLLQKMLSAHPGIRALSEPWIMLHPIYSLKESGLTSEYNSETALRALRAFLKELPSGEETYRRALKRMCLELYQEAMKGVSAEYFLDKTPRYYLIIRELADLFPDARFLILLRNPMAVLMSIVRTWMKDNVFQLREYNVDLFKAPLCLVDGIHFLSNKCVVVKYEDLVRDPETELKKICDHLQLSFLPEMINYKKSSSQRWEFGDQGTIYNASAPLADNADSWTESLKHPQLWRFASDYISQLNPSLLDLLGYPNESIASAVKAARPSRMKSLLTVRLSSVMKREDDYMSVLAEKSILQRLWMMQRMLPWPKN